MTVADMVNGVFERFYLEPCGLSRYDADNTYIYDMLDNLLTHCQEQGMINDYIISDYIVSEDTLFESRDHDTGYISVVWVTPDGQAHQDKRQWEVF